MLKTDIYDFINRWMLSFSSILKGRFVLQVAGCRLKNGLLSLSEST